MCQLSSDKIGVEHTLFTGNSGPQYFCELKSLQNHNLLKGAAWLTPVPPLCFLFLSAFLLFAYISLCFFKTSHEANVYCSSVPTGDQSLSYIHCLPRRNSRDWSVEHITKDRIGQPEVCILNYCLASYSCAVRNINSKVWEWIDRCHNPHAQQIDRNESSWGTLQANP